MISTSFAFFALLFLPFGDNVHGELDVDKEYAKVRGKIEDLFACVIKESGAAMEFKWALNGSIGDLFRLNCGLNAEQKSALANHSVRFTPKSISDFSSRLYDAGNKCLAQGGDFSGCCAHKNVPKVCLPLCGAKGTLDRDDSIFCHQHGKAIFDCYILEEKTNNSRLTPQFKVSDPEDLWSHNQCRDLDHGCSVVTLGMDLMALTVDTETFGLGGCLISLAGMATGITCARLKEVHCPCKD